MTARDDARAAVRALHVTDRAHGELLADAASDVWEPLLTEALGELGVAEHVWCGEWCNSRGDQCPEREDHPYRELRQKLRAALGMEPLP